MIGELGTRISGAFRRTAPDPFVIAVLLTLVTFVLVVARTGLTFDEAVRAWGGGGLWSLLKFGMQMCLILVTGHALASSPPVSRALDALAGMPRSPFGAVALVGLTATVLGVLNWGLALIAGALLARRVGVAMERRGVPVHYPLLAAAGYLGLLVWHGGFSGSAPLKVTEHAQIAEIFPGGAPFGELSLKTTILSPMNLFVTCGLVVFTPLLLALLSPKRSDLVQGAGAFGVREERHESAPEAHKPLIPRLLEDTPIVTAVLVFLIGWWAVRYYLVTPVVDETTGARARSGLFTLTPDTVNLTMLLLGLVCHVTPRRYVAAVEEAARGCAGIIIQFPLYAGIMGLMSAHGAAGGPTLAEQFAGGIAATANETTLPVGTMLSAGVVNLFVPSGGGQWAVQGPIAMNAAGDAFGGAVPAAYAGKMVMGVAYGDELTNMLQPFWALPLLAITGVKARDVVGYTAVVMVGAGVWMALGLLLF